MDINQLKIILEETQQKYPPHYPTKTHGITDEIPILLNNLKKVVDYIGFSNANIAVKNIVGKTINEFLISSRHGLNKNNCDFEIENQDIENGKKITISYSNKSLELEYLNNGVITITNNSNCPFLAYGEDYSNAIISYDSNKPNNLFLNQIFQNKSTCQSIMTFNEVGIEINKEFKIIPRTRTFQATTQCITGSITRKDDFYTASIKLNIIGRDFGNIISEEDINMISSIPEITVPISYMGALKNDLNLLYVVCADDRNSLRTGAIESLIGNYIYSEEDSYSFAEHYEESKKVIEYSNFLEFKYNSFNIGVPMIHAPYSFEILENIKGYVHKQENRQHIK